MTLDPYQSSIQKTDTVDKMTADESNPFQDITQDVNNTQLLQTLRTQLVMARKMIEKDKAVKL